MKCKICYIKKAFNFVICVVALGMTSNAQCYNISSLEYYVSLDSTIDVVACETKGLNDLVADSWGNVLYVTQYNNSNGDSLFIYSIDILSLDIDTIAVYVPQLAKEMVNRHATGFSFMACNGRTIYIGGSNYVYEIDINEESLPRLYKLPFSCQDIKFISNNKLVLYKYYYRGRELDNTRLAILDVRNWHVLYSVTPECGNMLPSYIGRRHNFDVANGRVLYQLPNEYIAFLYDSSLTCTDTILMPTEGRALIGDKLWQRAQCLPDHDAGGRISLFSQYEYDLQLWGYLIDSNTIVVNRTISVNDSCYPLHTCLSVYKRDGEHYGWCCSHTDLVDKVEQRYREKITASNMPLNWMGGNCVLFIGEKLVVLNRKGALGGYIGKTLGEHQIEENEYLREHEYHLQVNVFSHTLMSADCNR